MNLAVIGSGGREHAICYKLKQSPKIKKLICIPGNAGTQKIAENVEEDISNFEALYQIIKNKNIDIVIVGPEQPLVDGLVDYLNEKKVRVFGPDKFASQLEGSKAFMKNLCKKNNIPTFCVAARATAGGTYASSFFMHDFIIIESKCVENLLFSGKRVTANILKGTDQIPDDFGTGPGVMKSGLADITLENRKELKDTITKLANIILKKEELKIENADEDPEYFKKTASTSP